MQKLRHMVYNKGAAQELNMKRRQQLIRKEQSQLSDAQLRRRINVAFNLGKRNLAWLRTAKKMQAELNERVQNRK